MNEVKSRFLSLYLCAFLAKWHHKMYAKLAVSSSCLYRQPSLDELDTKENLRTWWFTGKFWREYNDSPRKCRPHWIRVLYLNVFCGFWRNLDGKYLPAWAVTHKHCCRNCRPWWWADQTIITNFLLFLKHPPPPPPHSLTTPDLVSNL